MSDLNETVYDHLAGNDFFTVTAAERWSIGMIRRLAKERPDEVEIVYENGDGSILAQVPVSWMRIRPKVRREMSQEQKDAAAERLRKLRENK